MIKIVVDAFGGDNAPHEIIKGGVLALNNYNNLKIVFTGNQDIIKQHLAQLKHPADRVEIIHAPDVIDNNQPPATAIRTMPNSSVVKAFDELRANDEVVGFVGAGSTGAVLTSAFLKLGRLKGVSRPALCPILPTVKNSQVAIIDCGANMDAKPINLVHFAMMGSAYLSSVFSVENPRVALLNVGIEEDKGNILTNQTFELLAAEKSINFVGNMEARELLSGDYDVVVCDGFAGNVLLKSTEGAIMSLLKMLKAEITKTKVRKLGALFMKKGFSNLKAKLNYTESGGAVLLGCKKLVVKSHGDSTAQNIYASIGQVIDMHQGKLVQKIAEHIESSIDENN